VAAPTLLASGREDDQRSLLHNLRTLVPNLGVDAMLEVMAEGSARGLSAAWALVAAGLVTREQVGCAAAVAAGTPLLEGLQIGAIDPEAMARNVPPILKVPALVIGRADAGGWKVAVSDPFGPDIDAVVRRTLGPEVSLVVADDTALRDAIRQVRSMEAIGGTAPTPVAPAAPLLTAAPADADDVEAEGPAARLVDAVITQAADEGASDIHLEPTGDGLRVRFRVDGVLRDVRTLRVDHAGSGEDIRRSVLSRLKVLGGLKIDETRAPHSGRIRRPADSGRLDLRLEIIPVVVGGSSHESAVLRLLASPDAPPTLDALGFSPASREAFAAVSSRPQGLVLVVGPTGSGKSTTLFACLSDRATPEKKVLTVEDPVEHRLSAAQQVEVIAGKITFPSALRSFMRQDPDIILVGETRDHETAQTACEAALTGHLVFTSLHTNSAAESPLRLVEMKVDPFLVANTLAGVVSQRLVRKLCPGCRRPATAAETVPILACWPVDEQPPGTELWSAGPGGCGRCRGSGYLGRTAVSEVMRATDAVRLAVLRGCASSDLHAIAVREGMIPIRVDAMAKVLAGETSVEEVHRVVL